MTRFLFNGNRVAMTGNRIAMATDCCSQCCYGVEYWNLDRSPITVQNFVAGPPKTYDLFEGATKIGEFPDFFYRWQDLCERYLLYVGATHDGATYTLPTPIVYGPWQGGAAITNRFPDLSDCYDMSELEYRDLTDPGPPKVFDTFPGKKGLNYSFTVDPERLYQSLFDQTFIDAQDNPVTACTIIPSGEEHNVLLRCVQYQIAVIERADTTNRTHYLGDTRINAIAEKNPFCFGTE